jgi:hypothetical protein
LILVRKKGARSDRWINFLQDGNYPLSTVVNKNIDFEEEFPDYNFIRKPRLGSM